MKNANEKKSRKSYRQNFWLQRRMLGIASNISGKWATWFWCLRHNKCLGGLRLADLNQNQTVHTGTSLAAAPVSCTGLWQRRGNILQSWVRAQRKLHDGQECTVLWAISFNNLEEIIININSSHQTWTYCRRNKRTRFAKIQIRKGLQRQSSFSTVLWGWS